MVQAQRSTERLPEPRFDEPAPIDPTLEWIAAAQAGDEAAFAELVQRFERPIYGFVLGLVRNTDDARDLMQEVWLRVARHLPHPLDRRARRSVRDGRLRGPL